MKNSGMWICLAMLMTSVASTLEFQDHPQKWRYQLSLVASLIFFLLFLAGLVITRRKGKTGR